MVEMVVVMAVLVAIAGLVIVKADFVRRQATMATAAVSTGDVANNLDLYLTTNSQLPNGLDTLLYDVNAATNPATATSVATGPNLVYGKLIGSLDEVGNLYQMLTPLALPNITGDKRLNCLVRMGMTTVNDNLGTSTDATNSGTSGRLLVAGSGLTPSQPVTPLTNANLALVTAANSQGLAIWKAVFPLNVWSAIYPTADGGTSTASTTEFGTTELGPIDGNGTMVSLVAFGVGPNNTMIGSTMTTPPQMAGPDTTVYYYRYVAIFAVYTDGRRAQLETVLDSFGRTTAGDISNYNSAGPADAPPNARTPE